MPDIAEEETDFAEDSVDHEVEDTLNEDALTDSELDDDAEDSDVSDTPDAEADSDSLTTVEQEDQQEQDREDNPGESLEALKKRLAGSTRSWQEERDRAKAYEQELEAARQELEAYKREQQQAAASKELPAFNPQSPKYQEYQQRKPLVEAFLKQYGQANDPDERAIVERYWANTISQEDLQTYEAERRHSQEFMTRLASDPRSALRELIQQETQGTLEQDREAARVRQYYQDLANRPENQVVKNSPELRAEFIKHIKSGIDPEVSLELLRLRASTPSAQQAVVEAEKAKLAAKAQKKLARKGATIERDQVVTKADTMSPLEQAEQTRKEKGWDRYDPRFLRLLANLEQSQE